MTPEERERFHFRRIELTAQMERERRQLHQQALASQNETIAMYERWAAEERQAGNDALAERYAERARSVRMRPLPNAA